MSQVLPVAHPVNLLPHPQNLQAHFRVHRAVDPYRPAPQTLYLHPAAQVHKEK